MFKFVAAVISLFFAIGAIAVMALGFYGEYQMHINHIDSGGGLGIGCFVGAALLGGFSAGIILNTKN